MTADVVRCSLIKDRSVNYGEPLDQPSAVYNIMKDLGATDSADEYLYLFCLDTHCNITGIHEVSHGTISQTATAPREIIKRALLNNAHGIILSHNHPSGDSTPSEADIMVTKRISECCDLMGIQFFDHVVVSDSGYTSIGEYLESFEAMTKSI